MTGEGGEEVVKPLFPIHFYITREKFSQVMLKTILPCWGKVFLTGKWAFVKEVLQPLLLPFLLFLFIFAGNLTTDSELKQPKGFRLFN